ncbi:hypothetical protein [Engelhardtia mirabilis]|uniref:DUF1565 domain-containing protein n=1 Tax=Engelhardtia mirabilis TaxID=2528011 RepID=A0A518BFD1_9BACT|nr:hypothetical protein Pla133_07550 [Planctomycetes bacterium Pla133]QDV00016.1 hypothetical protein Pla86_07540 [Planctomycetes bacterium Pla86]
MNPLTVLRTSGTRPSRLRSTGLHSARLRELAGALAAVAGLSLPSSALSAAGAVLVVDDFAGPGVDFTSIQAAVNASGPTDTILVRTGNYTGFVVNAKTATIVADSANVQVQGVVEVTNIAAGQKVVLHGLRITSTFGTALELTTCAGPVWIEDCAIDSSGLPVFQINDGVRLTGAAAAVISACSIVSSGDGTGGIGGGNGLLAQNSNLHLYDTTIVGGAVIGGVPGSPGLSMINGFTFASGCQFFGGDGGAGTLQGTFQICTDGGAGGPGISLTTVSSSPPATLVLLDTDSSGGNGGAPGGPACVSGSNGPSISTDGTSVVTDLGLNLAARHYTITSPVRSGETGLLEFTATPGELAWAIFSVDTAPLYFPAFTGSLGPAAPLIFVFAGQVPAGGTLALPVNISLPAGVPYALAYEQGLFFSLEDEFVLGTPRAGWVLAAGL